MVILGLKPPAYAWSKVLEAFGVEDISDIKPSEDDPSFLVKEY